MSEQLGHSADVQMHLVLNGYTLPITHMGPDFLRLQSSIEHPPAAGEVILTIDGHLSAPARTGAAPPRLIRFSVQRVFDTPSFLANTPPSILWRKRK
jgi:hypothetical protein